MGTSFEYSKTLAIEGSILMTLSPVPFVGWVLGIIGIVLLLRGLKELSLYYQDSSIYSESLTGVKYYIVALIAIAVAGSVFAVTYITIIRSLYLLAIPVAGLVVAFIFYVLAARHLKHTLETLAKRSGEHSFELSAMFLWIGAITTIIGVGVLLILVAWIFAVIGFFTMRAQPPQPYTAPPYDTTASSPQTQ